MSSDLAAPPATPTRRDQPLILCLVVAVAVVVGYLFLERWWLVHGLQELVRVWGSAPMDVYTFLAAMVPAAAVAVVLAVWGIDARHRVAGALAALLVGLVAWGLQEVLQRYVFEQDHMSQATLRAYDWAVVLLLPTLATIAWGLARRRGVRWWLGVPVAPLLASLHREAWLHSSTWQSWEFHHSQWWVQRLEFLAPIVVACLVCWALDRSSRRTPTSDRSEMQSSA
jgi:hypothetical protein